MLAAAGGFTDDKTDQLPLDASYFTGSNEFLTYIGTYTKDNTEEKPNDSIRSSSYIEIKGAVLQVTFIGTGTLAISTASTGGTNWSNIGLISPDGTYLKGDMTPVDGEFIEHELTDGNGYTYEFYGSGTTRTITFTIDQPGTYTIATAINDYTSGLQGENNNPNSRGAKISAIKMVDTYLDESSTDDEFTGTIYIDFADLSGDISSQFVSKNTTIMFDDYGILTLIDNENKTIPDENGYLKTSGKTSSSDSIPTNYFAIDLSKVAGKTVTITINFTSSKKSTDSSPERTLLISSAVSAYNKLQNNTVLDTATSGSTDDVKTVTWAGTSDDYDVVYIMYSDALYIDSITITVE